MVVNGCVKFWYADDGTSSTPHRAAVNSVSDFESHEECNAGASRDGRCAGKRKSEALAVQRGFAITAPKGANGD